MSTRPSVAATFAVDYVEPEKTILRKSRLGRVMEGTLNRNVRFNPFSERFVVAERSGTNPLIAALDLAFSKHLPVALSPDIVWLTIAQGFGHHVSEHAEALRHRLVTHAGTRTLNQELDALTTEALSRALAGFSSQIRAETDPAIHDALICDFSTTTPEARTASEIILMDTYSPYFEYEMEMLVCGIPSITLTGNAQDWQTIRERAEVLATFDLEWWVRHLRPILDEFIAAASGQANREFWRAIYKFQPGKGLYDRGKITGWIGSLFPYWGDIRPRTRNQSFDVGPGAPPALGPFPVGLCSVPVTLKKLLPNGQEFGRESLEFVAGLCGVTQDSEDATLMPGIAWCIAEPPPEPSKVP